MTHADRGSLYISSEDNLGEHRWLTLRADKLGKQEKGATALPKVKERKEAVSEVGGSWV